MWPLTSWQQQQQRRQPGGMGSTSAGDVGSAGSGAAHTAGAGAAQVPATGQRQARGLHGCVSHHRGCGQMGWQPRGSQHSSVTAQQVSGQQTRSSTQTDTRCAQVTVPTASRLPTYPLQIRQYLVTLVLVGLRNDTLTVHFDPSPSPCPASSYPPAPPAWPLPHACAKRVCRGAQTPVGPAPGQPAPG